MSGATRRGLTLIELLLALSIAGAVAAVAGTILVAALRLSRAGGERAAALTDVEAALAVVADDLAQAVESGGRRFRVDPGSGTLQCATLHGAGDPARLRSVTWRYEPERGALLRAAAPGGERVVAVALPPLRFAEEDGIPAVLVERGQGTLRIALLPGDRR